MSEGLSPGKAVMGGRGAGGVGPVEKKGSECSELAGLASLSWVIRQRGRAKLAEQPAAVLQLFLSAPREGCVRAKWGPDGHRAGARGASRSRERSSRLEARGSRPAAEPAGGGRPGRGGGGKCPPPVGGPGRGVSVPIATARGRARRRVGRGRRWVSE